MRHAILPIITIICLVFSVNRSNAQCPPHGNEPLSERVANYDIHVTLNDTTKIITATQTIRFVNNSPVAIPNLRIYHYLNAFKNSESSFLRGTSKIFGQQYLNRSAQGWGWMHIETLRRADGMDLSKNMRYVQPTDDNAADQSVLEVALDRPIAPKETVVFQLTWRAKMPQTIARAGFSKDFYLFCHWFPQLGVFEKNRAGTWDWNCHQFFRQTEFYADFGVYDVFLTIDKKFKIGASGCLVAQKDAPNGKITYHFHAADVIDFAWSIAERFEVIEDRWQEVQIRLLCPPEHLHLASRYLFALKFAFEYMHQHVGKYPYPTLTVIDPPFHGLRSGLMEYPTLITCGTFCCMPPGIRTMESLIIHEFVHQYFMGMVANNEKEEAWLDEGFVTYYEDRILDAAFGEKAALVDILGFQIGNAAQTRLEYTTMRDPRAAIVARPGWLFTESHFKPLIYSKPATTLRSVERMLGAEVMDRTMQQYFEKWKFKHPRGEDFLECLFNTIVTEKDSATALKIVDFFKTSIYQNVVLDYAVTDIQNETLPYPQGIFGDVPVHFTYKNDPTQPFTHRARVVAHRKGDWVFPVSLRIKFEDGTETTRLWSGESGMATFEFINTPKIVSAEIDPDCHLLLDLDRNNNSLQVAPATQPLWKYTAKAIFWVQNLLQTISFLS